MAYLLLRGQRRNMHLIHIAKASFQPKLVHFGLEDPPFFFFLLCLTHAGGIFPQIIFQKHQNIKR
ncbi:hypothetical protein AB205_0022350 [Aquarana catesbeiana]|uniref:Uncharacterized protein n=1 Tax=Aquarana catesbeiana TaxID=8400 RepID=A0A2G9RI53_AQUCT|nr:hypothetical protein AB205_0022350 [Aquarana catesbeiana]